MQQKNLITVKIKFGVERGPGTPRIRCFTLVNRSCSLKLEHHEPAMNIVTQWWQDYYLNFVEFHILVSIKTVPADAQLQMCDGCAMHLSQWKVRFGYHRIFLPKGPLRTSYRKIPHSNKRSAGHDNSRRPIILIKSNYFAFILEQI